MATGIFYAHSGWRYIVLLIFVVTIIKMLIGLVNKGRWAGLDEALNRFTPITMDIQFLLGLILWVVQQRWNGLDPTASWEHPVTLLVATALTHITSARAKKAPTDAAKFQTATVGYIIAGIVLALGIARITEVM